MGITQQVIDYAISTFLRKAKFKRLIKSQCKKDLVVGYLSGIDPRDPKTFKIADHGNGNYVIMWATLSCPFTQKHVDTNWSPWATT